MPDVIVAIDPMTTETLISGQGELELEIVRQKLQSKFGADAVRYWAAAARLCLDATYDEGQM